MDDLQNFLSSLKGQKILIWGLGANEGAVGVAKFFARHGALIRATDMKPREALEESIKALSEFPDIEYILGEHREEDFLWADIIMRNPAIPPSAPLLKFALEHDKQVEMELSLFMKYCNAKIVGITGTRGKTTTTALITKLMEDSGLKVTTGGNNRTPLLLQLETLTPDMYIIIEMSSFQLSNCTTSPEVAVVTNIYPDHLNWHPDMHDYISSKANIVRFQKAGDYAILNADNEKVIQYFKNGEHSGLGKKLLYGKTGDRVTIKDRSVCLDGQEYITEDELLIKGEHNLYNVAGAVTTGLALKIDTESIKKSILGFKGVTYRQENVGVVNGITFINDTTATTPEGLMVCLDRFVRDEGKRVHLIMGGVDKLFGFDKILPYLEKYPVSIHMFAGSFYDNIQKVLSDQIKAKMYGPFDTMESAFNSAVSKASEGDLVILSPCAASFNMFKNEFDRGDQFNTLVRNLI